MQIKAMENNMTGAYLFSKDEHGKRQPTEVEYLTKEERESALGKRSPKELLNWIHMLCESIVEIERFLESEGYSKIESVDTLEKEVHDNLDRQNRHSISGNMNNPANDQKEEFERNRHETHKE